MPQLVPDGPDLPDALLEAWDDNCVVFFCGAGVSARAGLPLFNDLVRAAYGRLSVAPPNKKDSAWAFPDRLLGDLERRFEARPVRKAIVEQLSGGNGDLKSHQALIELASFRDRAGLRLVTTNFDHLFERAAQAHQPCRPVYETPNLPPPLDDRDYRFRGLVYLHGRIGDEDDQRDLVLTSADFGRAYLTDGYARRFVLRLVQTFTPVFVGYSLDDPALRYIFDAIGAERAEHRRPQTKPAAFIFRSASESAVLPDGVVPVAYDPRSERGLKHGLLHATLEAWATWHRDPKTRLRDILRNSPDGLPTHELELVNWSVLGQGREPGFGAAIFHALSGPGEASPPPVSWVAILDEAETKRRKAYAEKVRCWEQAGQRGDEPTYPRLPLSDLVSPAHDQIKLPAGASKLATWLLRCLDSPQFVRHVIAQLDKASGRLHSHLRERIRDALAQGKVPEPFAGLWYALTAEAGWAEPARRKWRRGATGSRLSLLARTEFLDCLEPRLQLKISSRREMENALIRATGTEPDDTRPWAVHHLADTRVVLACGRMARTIVGQADQFDICDLTQLAWPVTDLLAQALELHTVLAVPDGGADPSDIGQRIGQAPEHANDWQLLRPLLWAAWIALDNSDGRSGRLLIDRWRFLGHPTFERFAVAAMGVSRQVTPEELLAWLLDDDARLLWDGIPLVDLDRPLQRLWRELGAKDRDRLLQAILAPPAEQQVPPYDGRGKRLTILAKAGGEELPHSARIHLMAFDAERARMMESERPVGAADLLALDDDHLLQRLESDRSRECEAAWDAAVRQEPLRALQLFGRLLADDSTPTRVLQEVVWQATPPSAGRNLVMRALDIVVDLPAGSIERRSYVAAALATFVARTVEQDWYDGATDAQLLALWDRLIASVVTVTKSVLDDPEPDLSTDWPIDELVLFLLQGLDRTKSTEVAERRAAFRDRLGQLTADRATFAATLRQLGRHLPFLHDVEPRWAEAHLLPAFAWHVDAVRARLAWQTYLAGSAHMPAALWPKMRLSFVETFKTDHLSVLSEGTKDRLAHLLVATLVFQSSRPLTDRAARRLLRACDLNMLRSAAWYMWRTVADEDQPVRRDSLWRSRLGRLLRDLWPREVDRGDSEVWGSLLLMAVALDDTFVEAIRAIEALAQPATIQNFRVLDELNDSSHPDHPDRANAVRWILDLPFVPAGEVTIITQIQARLARPPE